MLRGDGVLLVWREICRVRAGANAEACVLWVMCAQREAVHDARSLPVCTGENVYATDAAG